MNTDKKIAIRVDFQQVPVLRIKPQTSVINIRQLQPNHYTTLAHSVQSITGQLLSLSDAVIKDPKAQQSVLFSRMNTGS